MQLARGGDAGARSRRAIERRRLMRVLAVAQALAQVAADRAKGREPASASLRANQLDDRRVVDRGARIRLGGELLAQRQRRHALVPLSSASTGGVVGGIDDDRDMIVVLGRGADHGRAADVDVLDAVAKSAPLRDGRLRRDRGSRPEDRSRAMPCAAIAAAWSALSRMASRPPCTAGCSVFTRPSIISGKPVSSPTSRHGKPGLAERLARAAGGDELDAVAGERAGKLNEPGLVGNGDEGAGDEAKLLGHGVRVSQPTCG